MTSCLSRLSQHLMHWGRKYGLFSTMGLEESWKAHTREQLYAFPTKKDSEGKLNLELWARYRATHLENCRSLDSILLCLMHILVRADPISLVPPEKQNTRKVRPQRDAGMPARKHVSSLPEQLKNRFVITIKSAELRPHGYLPPWEEINSCSSRDQNQTIKHD